MLDFRTTTWTACKRGERKEKKRSFWRLNCVWKTVFLPIWKPSSPPSVVRSCVSAEKKMRGYRSISTFGIAFCSLPVQTRAKRLITVITKYNQNNLTMTASPDMKAKPQLIQVNYLHSCRYIHLCICSSDWEKKCISVEAVIQGDLF